MTPAPWASDPAATRGRRHAEPPAPGRDAFQRDRDRIVHSSAFRRLVYKTQVFLNHEGDMFRTRLTHSLEVSQVARSIGRPLGLNADLIEAIALAHDLGHTPFGHAGQDALHASLREAAPDGGGFEHNFQSLRVVDRLEERYAEFDGLNLSFETREGILKHCSARHARWLEAHDPTGIGRRFLEGTQPSLEAQLVNLADEIAYAVHDLDDGVRSGLLAFDQLEAVPLVRRFIEATRAAHPALGGRRLLFETLRRMLSALVFDAIEATRTALEHHQPPSADAVRTLPALVRFGRPTRAALDEVHRFLRLNLYRHPQVQATTDEARDVVRTLFAIYRADRGLLPADRATTGRPERQVADYIAGMTDRFAWKEHERLTGQPAPR